MKVYFACGGSAGHVNPALAMAEMLASAYPRASFSFFGRKGSLEERLVKKAGYPFTELAVEGLKRRLTPKNLRVAFLTLRAVARAKSILRADKPDLLIGTGGYVSFPALLAAKALHIPTLLHESNAVPGLAVKMCEKYADRILLQYEACRKHLGHPEKAVTVGAPLRRDFFRADRTAARHALGVRREDFLILSFGGSQGAERINTACLELMRDYSARKEGVRHIHACGEAHYERMQGAFRIDSAKTLLLPYIDDMPSCMMAADLVICRAGALTLAELSMLGKASVLVPSPHVPGDHQRKNAELYRARGASRVIEEGALTSSLLADTVESLRQNYRQLAEMQSAAHGLCRTDTKALFLSEVSSLLGSGLP